MRDIIKRRLEQEAKEQFQYDFLVSKRAKKENVSTEEIKRYIKYGRPKTGKFKIVKREDGGKADDKTAETKSDETSI